MGGAYHHSSNDSVAPKSGKLDHYDKESYLRNAGWSGHDAPDWAWRPAGLGGSLQGPGGLSRLLGLMVHTLQGLIPIHE